MKRQAEREQSPVRTKRARDKPHRQQQRAPRGPDYKTLLISQLGSQLSDEHVEDALFHHFKKFGDVGVKLSHTPELGRVAYVNFRNPEQAREARRSRTRLLLYDRPVKVEPMYMRRRSCTPPDTMTTAYQYRQRSLSPPGGAIREARLRHYGVESLGLGLARDYYTLLDERGRPYPLLTPEEEPKPEDDQRATRNLFVGNLEPGISEAELRRGFAKYGAIEEVVIKRPGRGTGTTPATAAALTSPAAAYAFLKFQNLDMAHRAKVAMQGRVFGGNPVKIGYGKANPSTRLWVGGLGPGTSLAVLAREFDRFGSIRTIDYVKGDSFAYVQYESLDAAQEACTQMRGFPLGGPERRLRVDFADVGETRGYSPYQCPAALLPSYESRGVGRDLVFEREWTSQVGAFGRGRRRRRSRSHSSEEKGRSRVRGPTPSPGPSPDPDSHHSNECQSGEVEKAEQQQQHHQPPCRPKKGKEAELAVKCAKDEPKADALKVTTLSEYAQTRPQVWRGMLVLKNSCFPVHLHQLEGGSALLLDLLQDSSAPGGRLTQLKIGQRLRLDQPKLDEVTRRIKLGGAEGYAVLLAVQGPLERETPPTEPGLQRRLLRNLVAYLRNKHAAGVIGLPLGGGGGGTAGGVLYAFPPCPFSQRYLKDAIQTLGPVEEEHLVVVIVRDSA